MRVSACVLPALLMVAPALADPPGNVTTNVQLSVDTYTDSLERPERTQRDLHDTCVRLMERAFYLADPASFDRAMDARREMEMARSAFHAGDDSACERHAIHALDDRS